jgi:prepilin-type N-terminal cleavage/methylation domain-containing protein
MLNKILSKKIKFPLSLLGLFPFCHSRESGNPSSPSLRGARRRSNLSGFSLIELMVAVAILAMAIFGIFHAYSVGFMGMADARDRTVATNYAREAMEDIKNMDFKKIVTTTKSVIISNIKYRVDVNVSLESPNLKKVFTVVNWKDRNGVGKTIETSMLVHSIEVFASSAAKIVLFADSYTILSDSTTNITAVIKDIKGNTVIDWDGDNISFSVSPSTGSGSLSDTTATTKGIATTTFNYDGIVGTGEVDVYVIEASVTLPPPNGNEVSDTVTIKVTDGPVKIGLIANPVIIKSNSTDCSTITVSLQNAVGVTLKKNILVSDVEITFSVFGDFSEGDLSSSTIIITPGSSDEDAVGTINLCPTSKRGLASVVATATDLESDTVDVRFLGPPVSISISANPNSIYTDDIEGSIIMVSLIDENGFNTNPDSGNISVYLALDTYPDDGLAILAISPLPLVFYSTDAIGDSKTTEFMWQSELMGTAIINASGGGLIEDSVTISIRDALVPDNIKLTASHQIVPAGGTSEITATVCDGSKTAINYIGTITFKTTLGTFLGGTTNITKVVGGGKATTVLTSSSEFPGNAIITITDPAPAVLPFNPPDGLVVGFYSGADHIELKASSQNVVAGGSSIITATVCDFKGITVTNYDGTITFATTLGVFSDSNTVDVENGVATTVLTSTSTGDAIITITDTTPTVLPFNPPDGLVVGFYEETALILVDVNCTPTCDIITFDVIVIGETGVSIEVDEMKIIWDNSSPSERLYKIVIDDDDEIYNGSAKSGTIIDINPNEYLSIEEHTIELTFIQDMAGRQIDVMFYPPEEGWYLIRFVVPVAP